MVAVDVKEMVLSVVVVMVEERRRFREPRSTFNHLRSITSAEVMAAFSCRGRTGMVRSSSPLYGAYSPFLFVSLSLSFSLASTLLASLALASPFVHVIPGHCVRGIVGGAVQVCPRLRAIWSTSNWPGLNENDPLSYFSDYLIAFLLLPWWIYDSMRNIDCSGWCLLSDCTHLFVSLMSRNRILCRRSPRNDCAKIVAIHCRIFRLQEIRLLLLS